MKNVGMNIAKCLLVLWVGCVTSCKTVEVPQGETLSEYPKREFRGAWIQTAFQGEYKEMTPAEMRRSFIRKLNFLKDCGINAIIFQVRPEADAFYRSELGLGAAFIPESRALPRKGILT